MITALGGSLGFNKGSFDPAEDVLLLEPACSSISPSSICCCTVESEVEVLVGPVTDELEVFGLSLLLAPRLSLDLPAASELVRRDSGERVS